MDKPKRPEEIYAISGYVITDNSATALYRFIKLKLDKFSSYKEIDSVYIPMSGVDEFLSDGKEFAYREMPSVEFIRNLPRFSIAGRVLKSGISQILDIQSSGSEGKYISSLLLIDEKGVLQEAYRNGNARERTVSSVLSQVFMGEAVFVEGVLLGDKFLSERKRLEELSLGAKLSVGRDRLTKRDLSKKIVGIRDGRHIGVCAKGLSGVGNGVNSYPEYVEAVSVSVTELQTSGTSVLDMARCSGLNEFNLSDSRIQACKLESLSLYFPPVLSVDGREGDECHFYSEIFTYLGRHIRFINFPKMNQFKSVTLAGCAVEGLDATLGTHTCWIERCTGLKELSVWVKYPHYTATGRHKIEDYPNASHIEVGDIDAESLELLSVRIGSSMTGDMAATVHIGECKKLKSIRIKFIGEVFNLEWLTMRTLRFYIGGCEAVEEITIDLTAVRLLREVSLEDGICFGGGNFPKLQKVKILGVESKALNGIAFPSGCACKIR